MSGFAVAAGRLAASRAIHSTVAAAAVVVAVMASGCSITETISEKGRIDYKSAGKLPPLDLPPDLSQMRGDDRFAMPDRPSSERTFSGYSSAQPAQRTPSAAGVLPAVAGARIERAGNQRWLVIDQSADKLWPLVREFWQESGFVIASESPATGILETDWAENRAKIPQDFIRNTIGKAFDNLYSTGERDKFRTRLEPRADGGTEVYITHRGMIEEYSSPQKDSTIWQPRPSDPELEAEFLRRLMVRLGVDQEKASGAVAQARDRTQDRARLETVDGRSVVEITEGFDRAWRRVGLALDRGGFTVEDRDRSQGVYFVRYIDPEAEAAAARKPGFFGRIFASKSSNESASQRFRVRVDGSAADATRVTVLDREGKPLSSEPDRRTGSRILALLQEQLRQ